MLSSSRICVSIARKNTAEAVAAAESVVGQADVLEIRLDYLTDPIITPFMEKLHIPLLFTNRPQWEGGQFNGAEEERLEPLLQAVSQNAAYVDLELLAPADSQQKMRSAMQNSESKLLLSWHNFSDTPSREELVGRLAMMQDNGADIGKIITTAHDQNDVLRVLQLQETAAQLNFPLISFCMGKVGMISRVATCELGGYMTYCATSVDDATAPGQLSISTLREIQLLLGVDL
ncbi:MAG: type I 3-dehydroquinate dehydratase [Desulfocapsa sp.]|nr:MAG: type I 3-dehydroquinate dehydratase [Desulfocapsa sp.]